MAFVVVKNPSPNVVWIHHPLLLMGMGSDPGVSTDAVIRIGPERDDAAGALVLPIRIGGIVTDSDLADMAYCVGDMMKRGRVVYVYDEEHGELGIPLMVCVIRILFGVSNQEAIRYVNTACHARKRPRKLTALQLAQLHRYRPPITAIFCGSRDGCVEFEEAIISELKTLPRNSRVVHGGCKGIDQYVATLAKQFGMIVVEYPVTQEEWKRIGPAAGPIRNRKMLEEERPDVIFAFHPDITLSKGTADMMMQGWKAGVEVYIHDLTRRCRFEGDFDV